MLKLGVTIPATAGMDFDFNDARPMPFLSAPSTPRPFGAYSLSAPTSPPRVPDFHRHFEDDEFNGGEGRSGIPFNWPGTPKSPPARSASNTDIEDDFAFDLSAELENVSLWADELFDGGKIKPLKPPSGLQPDEPISPRSPVARGRKIIREVFSPRKKKDSDPFATAMESREKRTENERGRERISGQTRRERISGLTTSSRCHRATRSLSPLRGVELPWEEEGEGEEQKEKTATQASAVVNQNDSNYSTPTSKNSSKKWRLRDFLLFRSASEGRASDKDPLGRYRANLCRRHEEVKGTTSFRSRDSDSGSVRKGRVSAHEMHYKTNKAASDGLKKKTFLPYKQGILGRFAFNPTIHALR